MDIYRVHAKVGHRGSDYLENQRSRGHKAQLFLAGYVRILEANQDARFSSSCNLEFQNEGLFWEGI